MYIAVPHSAHKDLAIRAMNAGFHVLVEKPATVTASDWDEMIKCAEKNHVFLMEAMWTFSWSRLGCLQWSEFSLIQHGLHRVKESNMQPHT